MFCCVDVQLYHLWDKSRFVCAHIGQNRDIYPPSIFRLHFWLVPPPPFAQVDGGGCYREKFFLILFFSFLLFDFYSYFIFLFFLNPLSTRSNYTSIFIFFWFSLVIYQKSGLKIFWILHSLFLIIKFLEYFSRVNINSYLFRLVSALFILRFIS